VQQADRFRQLDDVRNFIVTLDAQRVDQQQRVGLAVFDQQDANRRGRELSAAA
jgi:hypothetical protein